MYIFEALGFHFWDNRLSFGYHKQSQPHIYSELKDKKEHALVYNLQTINTLQMYTLEDQFTVYDSLYFSFSKYSVALVTV